MNETLGQNTEIENRAVVILPIKNEFAFIYRPGAIKENFSRNVVEICPRDLLIRYL